MRINLHELFNPDEPRNIGSSFWLKTFIKLFLPLAVQQYVPNIILMEGESDKFLITDLWEFVRYARRTSMWVDV